MCSLKLVLRNNVMSSNVFDVRGIGAFVCGAVELYLGVAR